MSTKVKETKISELIPDNLNANKGTEYGQHLMEKSFREFGAGRSILLDKNNRIIAGNKSINTAASIGMENVVVVETTGDQIVAVKRMDIDLDSKQGRELALADNATSKANLAWDEDIIKGLESEWDIQPEDWGITEFADVEVLEAEEDEFDVPEGGVETDIVLGDIFEIGEHRLICGDSTQTDTFERLMGGKLADMVLTDPPYNVAYEGKTKDALTIENDSMGDDDFYQFLYDFYTAISTATKKGGAIYVWHASSEIINFAKAMVDAGWLLKQQLIWLKNAMVMGRQDYQWKHEPCLYGWLAGDSHKWYSDRKQTTILEFDKPFRNAEHPTMKPIELFSYQIGNSSQKGDIILDAFAGSGTTMVASHQTKRRAYYVEFDPRYCQVIVDRMIKLDPTIKITKNGQKYEPK